MWEGGHARRREADVCPAPHTLVTIGSGSFAACLVKRKEEIHYLFK